MKRTACALAIVLAVAATAHAGPTSPDIPTPPHPRLFLDGEMHAAWKRAAARKDSAVARAIVKCKDIARRPKEFSHDNYMGLDWAGYLQTCLVAWAATGDQPYADTAMTYFVALIDDLVDIGDGKGGDEAARRDSGYSIRALGPYTALAYDWLHDQPAMTEAVRARARQRFAAWTDWYIDNGYRARSPSTNYQAGFLIAATFIAIAQNGEADKAGNDLWRLVRDDLWGKDMAAAFAAGGVLDGGDWGEGWEYAPLSIVEYAVAARAMAGAGVANPAVRPWLDAVVRRHVHALSPGAGIFAGQDTQEETANVVPNYLTLAAAIVGGASPDSQAWAASEIARLKLTYDQFALYPALVEAAEITAAPVPRDAWPTSYLAAGVGTFFARSFWDKDAVWMVAQCSRTIDVDHVHAKAGNLVLSRGPDDLLVDPSPYGTLSTMTSNAPTVESAQLPDEYKPSQAFWSVATGYAWAQQTASGVIAVRCDYTDQYKFQDNPSDVPRAQRDVVVFPAAGGKDAAAFVIDRAASGDAKRSLHLRFRAQAKLAGKGGANEIVRGERGRSALTIQRLWSSGGTPETRSLPAGDCFHGDHSRGNCDAARFAVDEWRLVVPGPTMEAATLLDVGPSGASPKPAAVARAGELAVITADRGGAIAVVVGGGSSITYTGPAAARHVVLDAVPDAAVTASTVAGGCSVTVASGGNGAHTGGRPAVFALDAACKVTVDPTQARPAQPTVGAPDGPAPSSPHSARTGCCGAETSPGSPLAMAAAVGVWWLTLGRRRRPPASEASDQQ